MVLFLLPLSSLTLTLQVFASKQPLSPYFFKTTFLPPKKLNIKHSLVYDVVHMFSCFSLPALRIEQSAGSDVPSGKTPPPQGEAFSSFSIFHHHHYPDHTITITLIIPSSSPHHDHHACYHNHHLNLERSFFCSFKIVAFYCVSPPSADIFSFVSFCTSFVVPLVNFNLWEYNNPPISN